MLRDNKVGEGRAAVTLATKGVESAIDQWRNAPAEEKGAKAEKVLSHIGGLSGMRLSDFTDPETTNQIKTDYASANE